MSSGVTITWSGTEDQQWAERIKACQSRCKQWGYTDCADEGGEGICAECEDDMAVALETPASKIRRAKLAMKGQP